MTRVREELAALASSLVSLLRVRRFLLVGFVGMATDMALIAALVEGTGLEPVVAKFVSAEGAILVMFAINERWTFKRYQVGGWKGLWRRLFTSNAVRVVGVLVAAGILYLLHNLFGVWYLLANLIGIGGAFFANYVMESLFTWRVQQD